MSIHEAECLIDIGIFLDEYPRWELRTPHRAIILHEMFLHTAERGQKEAEQMVCWGCCGSVQDLSSEVDQSAMELVGYNTSHKGDERCLPEHLPVKKDPRSSPLWSSVKEKGNSRHTFFSRGPLCRCGHSTTVRNLEHQEKQDGPN